MPLMRCLLRRGTATKAFCAPITLLSRGGAPSALHTAHRPITVAGGGRGDLFKRHAAAYKAPYAGAARGIRDPSESTSPQDGQLHIRKRHDHIAFDRQYSGATHGRAAIAAWSYLVPSLRKNVEAACPAALYDALMAGESTLSQAEVQQLTEAQRLFRFELQQRIGLLEDSLAEAELPFLIQWPALFQRVWLRLPLRATEAAEERVAAAPSAAENTATAAPSLALSAAAEHALVPLSTAVWASPSSALSAGMGKDKSGLSFESRLEVLTRHVVDCVEAELKALEASASQRSRRQAALEASWRAQWQSAVAWHSDNER